MKFEWIILHKEDLYDENTFYCITEYALLTGGILFRNKVLEVPTGGFAKIKTVTIEFVPMTAPDIDDFVDANS